MNISHRPLLEIILLQMCPTTLEAIQYLLHKLLRMGVTTEDNLKFSSHIHCK